MARRVRVEENGRSRNLSLEEIIIRRLATAAAKGDLKAVKLLFDLRSRYGRLPCRELRSARPSVRTKTFSTPMWWPDSPSSLPAPAPNAANVVSGLEDSPDTAIGDPSEKPREDA